MLLPLENMTVSYRSHPEHHLIDTLFIGSHHYGNITEEATLGEMPSRLSQRRRHCRLKVVSRCEQ